MAHLDGKAFGRVTYESGAATASAAASGGYEGGAATATDLRFYGHIEDPETGLFYNRYRHYDPDTGRYLSPEPLGLMGGLSPFGYAANDPVGMVDPDGLMMFRTHEGIERGSSQEPSERSADRKLHPAIEAALPADSHVAPNRNGSRRHPSTCAEPMALSDHLRAHEAKLGRELNPNNAADRREISIRIRSTNPVLDRALTLGR